MTSKQVTLRRRPDESTEEFFLRVERHEAWRQGYASGHSRAMRMMTDEPMVQDAVNPYADDEEPVDV